MVAVGAAAGGVDKAFDLGIAGGYQHVEEAGDVGGVAGDGVGHAAGDAAQGGLVQDVVHASGGLLAIVQVTDVTLDELEVVPLRGGDQALHFIQVALVAGGKVVQSNDALVEFEQGFKQVAADEAGHTSDEPCFGLGLQVSLELLVCRHD